MSQLKLCSLDIETLDTKSTAKIISIGAVDVYGDESFYVEIDPFQMHRTESVDTKTWWLQQPYMPDGRLKLYQALEKFAAWYKIQEFTEVWCRGTDFDITILAHAFAQNQLAVPWEYNHPRDLRTLGKLFPHVKAPYRWGAHHALCDAMNQAIYLQELLGYVKRFGFNQIGSCVGAACSDSSNGVREARVVVNGQSQIRDISGGIPTTESGISKWTSLETGENSTGTTS